MQPWSSGETTACFRGLLERIPWVRALEQGRYLKANATPVFRMGKKKDPGNYKPVSLTFVLGKITKLLIPEVISEDVEVKITRNRQHGFMEGKSCLTSVIVFCDGVARHVGEGRAVDVVYLDFSKALDIDSYDILIR